MKKVLILDKSECKDPCYPNITDIKYSKRWAQEADLILVDINEDQYYVLKDRESINYCYINKFELDGMLSIGNAKINNPLSI